MRIRPFLLAILLAAPLAAQAIAPGPKSMAMGGTFAAVADDASSLWGNPAGLADCKLGCFSAFAGGIATDENEFANRLNDDFRGVDFADFAQGRNLDRIPRLVSDLHRFETPGTGTIASGAGGVAYAIRGFGIGIGETAYAGVYPTIDLVHVNPDDFQQNATRATFRGFQGRELRIGYAWNLYGDILVVGLATRYIQGRTYFDERSILQAADDPVGISREAIRHNEKRTSRVAFDAGAIFRPVHQLRIGLVAQSLNEPSFRVSDGSRIELGRILRLGAAFSPLTYEGIVITADADLNKQKTLVPGLRSQRIAAGAQIYWIRLGVYRDLEAVDPHFAYTAGVHVGNKLISLGLAGVYAPGKKDAGAAVDLRIKL
jgi:hypothetical protein